MSGISAAVGLIRSVLPMLRWYLLTLCSGMVNTGSFIACGWFVSHVTGFATLTGISVERNEWVAALSVFTVPLYFLLGSMFSAWMVDTRISRGLNPLYGFPLVIVTLLLTATALAGTSGWFGPFDGDPDPRRHYLMLVMLCLASGIQNAIVTTATGGILRSSHLTGTTTDLGSGIMRALLMPRGSLERQLENRLNWLRFGVIAAFVGGAIAGAFCFAHWQFGGFLLPATISLLVAVWVSADHAFDGRRNSSAQA